MREWHSIERMPTVPFKADEIADEKRETTGELTIVAEGFAAVISAKPEAIVRPLRRREPSDDDNPPPDLRDLEAQIIDKLTNLEKEKPPKAQRDSIKEKPPQFRWNQSRESKKSSRDVSDLSAWNFPSVVVPENWKINSGEITFTSLSLAPAAIFSSSLIRLDLID